MLAGLTVGACTSEPSTVELDDAALVGLYVAWGDPSTSDLVERRYHAALEDAVAACMDGAGFEYVPAPYETSAFGPGRGITAEDFARRFGYGVTTEDEVLATGLARLDDPNDSYLAGLTHEQFNAYGDAATRCRAAAAAEIQPPDSFQADVEGLQRRVLQSPEGQDATQRWADCMKLPEQYAHARSSDELVQLIATTARQAADPADLVPLEIDLAVRDLECGQQLRRDLAAASEEFQPQFIASHQSDLALLRSALGD